MTCRYNAALHYELEINMHNADTFLDKAPGQGYTEYVKRGLMTMDGKIPTEKRYRSLM